MLSRVFFHGPFPWRLLKSFRRRYREATATLVVAVVVLTGVDFSGQWRGTGATPEVNALWNVQVYHIGNRISGYTSDGDLRFDGLLTADSTFRGSVFLRQIGEGTTVDDCDHREAPLSVTQDRHSGGTDLLLTYYGNTYGNGCLITARPRYTIRLIKDTL